MQIKLKYLVKDRDRYGNLRIYVRLPGRKKVRIRAKLGTTEFTQEYAYAIEKRATLPLSRNVPRGSFVWLCQHYFASPDFSNKDISTRKWHRRALEDICRQHGDKPANMMMQRHVRMIRNERSEKPAAANQRLKALRQLFRWAVEENYADTDPTTGVKGFRYHTEGHHSWTPSEIERYEARYALGTKPRLAKDLLQYTTGRREDVTRFGPHQIRDNRIRFTQAKNEHRNAVEVDIPLHPKLAASIEAYAKTQKVRHHHTFLVTEYGKPFTANGFGNWFRKRCDSAGLPQCSAHGLRKATATALAEAGATPHEIKSITGHRRLEEVERYTRAAEMKKLADSAMQKLK